MAQDIVPGTDIVINFETYYVKECDSNTRRLFAELYQIHIDDKYIRDMSRETPPNVTLVNKIDKHFCNAMENDVELNWAMKDLQGGN